MSDPFFNVEIEKDVSVIHELPYKIYLQNLSDYPAYDVVLQKVLDKENRIILPSKLQGKIKIFFRPCIAPKERSLIMRLSEDIVKNACLTSFLLIN